MTDLDWIVLASAVTVMFIIYKTLRKPYVLVFSLNDSIKFTGTMKFKNYDDALYYAKCIDDIYDNIWLENHDTGAIKTLKRGTL
jgi:hypothetical protein